MNSQTVVSDTHHHKTSASPSQFHSKITATLNDRNQTIDGFLELEYFNRSEDTLNFIWVQLWPNAFKSDKTAFSEYMLEKDRTDFYFAGKEKRGYINRLDFRQNNIVLKPEDHPHHIDITRVILDKPIYPGNQVKITTPFHVKLPYNFDGIGYSFMRYHLKHWYPVPAAYINGEWQPKPYTGAESNSETEGNFDVYLTMPLHFFAESNGRLIDSLIIDSLKRLHYSAQHVPDLHLSIVKSGRLSTEAKKNGRDELNVKKHMILSRRILPAAGFNNYDGLQLGIFIHEPDTTRKFSWFAAPVFAFKSKRLTGTGGVSYLLKPYRFLQQIEIGLNASTFSTDDGRDSLGKKVFADMYKVVPFVKLDLPSPSYKIKRSIEFKTYIIGERDLEYSMNSNSMFYPGKGKTKKRYLNQLTFNYSINRALYPHSAQVQIQQSKSFYRINLTGRHYFNYPDGGGMNVRLFAAKFGYLGAQTPAKRFETLRYQPKLTAIRGNEDYTYSNYFIGRNEFDGLLSQQVMMRDGDLKLRTDIFEDLQGRSDKWVASVNFSSTLPDIFPIRVPWRIFLDAGTYSDSWERETSQPRFLYVAGLQLSLFREFLNIYAPLLYSQRFRDRLKSVPEQNTFFKKISFSIDVQRFRLRSFHHTKQFV